jgi:hypothetical protein
MRPLRSFLTFAERVPAAWLSNSAVSSVQRAWPVATPSKQSAPVSHHDSYRIETGPRNKVTAIEFWFQLKDVSDVVVAEREREASRVGREARRKGRVERTISVLDLPPLQPKGEK